MLSGRRTRHERLAGTLAHLDDGELAAGTTVGVGVGGDTAVLAVDDATVFVKRIPLTQRERARPHTTANLFGVPNRCHRAST